MKQRLFGKGEIRRADRSRVRARAREREGEEREGNRKRRKKSKDNSLRARFLKRKIHTQKKNETVAK